MTRVAAVDCGTNSIRLLIHDTEAGEVSRRNTIVRLGQGVDETGAFAPEAIERTRAALADYVEEMQREGVTRVRMVATSATRDAANREDFFAMTRELLGRVQPGAVAEVISGEEEARSTFQAVRRWYGWSAGRITNLDIGGGSLELSTGTDEHPDLAFSLDLGAGRLTHNWFDTDPPEKKKVSALRDFIDAELEDAVTQMKAMGPAGLAVGTSKTFRTLARLTGSAPSSAGPYVKRTLTAPGLRQLISFISRMTAADRADLEGVSSNRSHQIVAGALVAEASMRALDIEKLEICPWALREGVILRRTDKGLE